MTTQSAAPSRMPVLFVGHGSPMNAIEDNPWSRAFKQLGQELRTELPKPKAILAISAHWFVDRTLLTAEARPKTIHDFGGFPRALYEIQYPAPGNPELAEQIMQVLAAHRAATSKEWGLDHGTWSVLVHTHPEAEIPVVQLSINRRLTPEQHLALGSELLPLREAGVLILGSGNIVHNLRHAFSSYSRGDTTLPEWAVQFDSGVTEALEQRDATYLTQTLSSDVGGLAHPSPDHYLPLLYSFGATDERDAVTFPIQGFDMGSVSMRAVRFG